LVALVAANRRHAAIAVALFLMITAPSAAQYLQRYKEGLEAAEAGKWQASAEAMRSAIAERTDEKSSLPLRSYFKPYLPHYHLGRALFELGDCEGARTSWAESQRQGVIDNRVAELEVMRANLAECDQRGREQTLAAAAEQGAAEALRRAERARASLDELSSSQAASIWAEGAPSFAERASQVDDALKRARERFAEGRAGGGAAAFSDAEALARSAESDLEDVRRDAMRLLGEREAQDTDRRSRLDVLVGDARTLLERTKAIAAYGRQLGRARADLEGLVAEHDRAMGGGATGAGDGRTLEGLASRLSFSIERLAELSAPPPPALVTAVSAFFDREYAKVIETLGRARFDEPRARAHALLLSSAARYHLWVESGETDDAVLAAASGDVLEYRRLGVRLTLPRGLLSPRFQAFLEAGGSPGGPSSE
jgi:hypothetical protein